MNIRGLLVAAGLLATATNANALPYGFFDARSVAMGNTSVATGGLATAAFSNPGMLTVNEGEDKFALLLPAVGVQVIDDADVIDLVDEFQALEGDLTLPALQRQADILNELNNTSVIVAVNAGTAFVYAGDDFTWGVTYRADASVSALVDNVTGVSPPSASANADVTALGILVQEIGIPIGTDFSAGGFDLSFGITPKLVQVETIEYIATAVTSDIENIDDLDSEDLGSFTTLDAGITLNAFDTFRVGLVAKNLIEESKTNSFGRTIDFDTHLRAGAAIDLEFLTIAADMDLTERDPIANESPSQSASVGVEINTFDIVQLRAGYQTNLASGATDPDLLSVGVGIWLGFHLDVAVVAGEDSSLGAFLQTGFRF